MTSVNPEYPGHIFSLLDLSLSALRREMGDILAGSRRIPSPMRAMRPSQLRLLSLTPAEGMRLTDLAERVGMTKQALGEFATALEEQGLLETVRDPADRRVRILRPTRAGLAVSARSDRIIGELEDRWRARLGAEDWEVLRDVLARIHDLSREGAG